MKFEPNKHILISINYDIEYLISVWIMIPCITLSLSLSVYIYTTVI